MSVKKMIVLITLIGLLSAHLSGTANAAPGTAAVPVNVHFEPVASGLTAPLFAAHAGDGSGRLFIVEKGGLIKILKNGSILSTPFLDISALISQSGEQGLLGLAFAPNYPSSGSFYVCYTAPNYDITLARYQVSANADIADAASGQVLLSIPKTYTNHNGGMLSFGPDNFLYMSTGDGGGSGDPSNNAQNRRSLLGKILRLDVSGGGAYKIPPTNPYANNTIGLKKEIWAYGLRNPWRFSFDSLVGDLYIADVGQNIQEEINFQTKSSSGGRNYGWRIKEGNLCYNPINCTPPANYSAPILVYDHGDNDINGCSVTGGYVYRGKNFPEMSGVYLFADFCTGKLWGAVRNTSGKWTSTLISDSSFRINSFAEDENGEVYIVDYSGQLLRIDRAAVSELTFISNWSHDGFIRESTETSSTGGVLNSTADNLLIGDSAFKQQYRSLLSFNTFRLPDNAVILSAQIRLKLQKQTRNNPITTHGPILVDLQSPHFGNFNALELADFSSAAIPGATGKIGNLPTDGFYTGLLPEISLGHINRTGFTQLRLRFKLDDNNDSTPDFLAFYSGEAALPLYRPALKITYFIP